MKVTIKTNILIAFLIIFGLISLSLLGSQYYFSYKIAINSTDQTFKMTVKDIHSQFIKDSKAIKNTLIANKNNKNFFHPITFDYKHPALTNLIQLMNLNQEIYSMSITHKDSSFFQLINIKESNLLFELHKAPKESRWIVIIDIDNTRQYSFLDNDMNILSIYFRKEKFNPLLRPWYKEARASKGAISTDLYKFHNIDTTGATYAIELEQSASVFAIDYTSKVLNNILKLEKFNEDSEIFVFTKNGNIVASSNDTLKKIDPFLHKAFLEQKEKRSIRYRYKGKGYLTIYKSLKTKGLFLAIKINADKLMQPFIENLKYSFAIAFLLLVLSIPIIYYISALLIKPVKALIQENKKIKNRNFNEVMNIDTNIIEYLELSNSFVSMSKNIQDYQKSQAELLDSIVKLIAEAVDAKSPYTGGHCKRVPEIAQMLINETNKSKNEAFKDFSLESDDELKEFEIGAWLHDCGKVTTPEYVVDKSTKLETINDRIHEVRTRFEVLWRDAQIDYLNAQVKGEDKTISLEILHKKQAQLSDDFSFIANTNIGGEFMSQDKQDRVKEIANKEWIRNFDDSLGLGEVEILRYDKQNAQKLPAIEKLLSDKKQHIIKRDFFDKESYEKNGFKDKVPTNLYNYGEIYNLCIAKGTLSDEERFKINEHVILSIKMLEKIPFPTNMTRIPEYAGTHHETLIGTGYPRKLTKNELSIPARIMAIADVFEALTASDRPYKKAKTLSQAIKILSFMVKDKHLDEDLFKLFLSSGLHLSYAKKYLKDEQIDDIDIEQYL